MKVDLCVVSYRRPRGLRRLLGALQELELPEPAPQLRVVVVDNDPEQSARAVCHEAETWLRFPLDFRWEKRRGIPQARNAALAAALGRSDFVAFIDDDETPDPGWLAELLRVQAVYGAEAVTGPCLPIFEEPAPGWVLAGELFERPRRETGSRVGTAATHNALIATPALSSMARLFDERMALCGGSDDEFFRRFVAAGHRIVWADAALVQEWVPASRLKLGWILRRAFRVGSSAALVERRLAEVPVPWPRHLAHALWCIAKGSVLALLALPQGFGGCVREARLAATGAGRLAGLFGFAYQEYRTPHGG
jgi:glycosyltransferase involved in cell wall biosynthesis